MSSVPAPASRAPSRAAFSSFNVLLAFALGLELIPMIFTQIAF
jgi:hypothetical protein